MHGHFKTETNNTSRKGNTTLWQLPKRKIWIEIQNPDLCSETVKHDEGNISKEIWQGEYEHYDEGNMSEGNI